MTNKPIVIIEIIVIFIMAFKETFEKHFKWTFEGPFKETFQENPKRRLSTYSNLKSTKLKTTRQLYYRLKRRLRNIFCINDEKVFLT